MTLEQYVNFSVPDLQFYCRQCISYVDGSYNFAAGLSRIKSHAPNLTNMQTQAVSERNMMAFYGAALPTVSNPTDSEVDVDNVSIAMLRDRCPWILDQFVPSSVGGDGNCLFRAISFALYGHENCYMQLRLLTAIETLTNRDVYDTASPDFYAPYAADSCLVLSDYASFAVETARNGSDSDMLTVLALSSVVQKPIQTRWPIVTDDVSPMTKRVGPSATAGLMQTAQLVRSCGLLLA